LKLSKNATKSVKQEMKNMIAEGKDSDKNAANKPK